MAIFIVIIMSKTAMLQSTRVLFIKEKDIIIVTYYYRNSAGKAISYGDS